MISRSMSSVYFPGITIAIQDHRDRYNDCNRNAPLQPSSLPYSYRHLSIRFNVYMWASFPTRDLYLFAVDRYSNWPIIERAHEWSRGLLDCLQRQFSTFGISDELFSYGSPEFTPTATSTFLKNWGIQHHFFCWFWRWQAGLRFTIRLQWDES